MGTAQSTRYHGTDPRTRDQGPGETGPSHLFVPGRAVPAWDSHMHHRQGVIMLSRAGAPVTGAVHPSTGVESPDRPVVVGVDGSPASIRALRWACEDAALRGVSLRAVAVCSPLALSRSGQLVHSAPSLSQHPEVVTGEYLEKVVAPVVGRFPGLCIERDVRQGRIEDALEVASHAATVVVVGITSATQQPPLLRGSATAVIAQRTASTFVTVREDIVRQPARVLASTKPVVVGVDGSEAGRRALAWAYDEAELRGVGVRAVAVCTQAVGSVVVVTGPGTAAIADQESAAAAQLESAVAALHVSQAGPSVDQVVVQGDAGACLVEQARSGQLLVLGTRHRQEERPERVTRSGRWLGSTTTRA